MMTCIRNLGAGRTVGYRWVGEQFRFVVLDVHVGIGPSDVSKEFLIKSISSCFYSAAGVKQRATGGRQEAGGVCARQTGLPPPLSAAIILQTPGCRNISNRHSTFSGHGGVGT